ncbi:MAG: HAMP domain-containing protein, partial [Planctomycetota bacterium]|nr:HAMP domain-containing protein [Planctomycetota bacterium]
MLENVGLRIKIFFLVIVAVSAAFLAVAWIVANRTVEMAKNDAFDLAQETAEKYKNEIRAELQGARITAETLATAFSSLKENGLTDRGMMNDILKSALATKDYITAFCVAYDPNALDGLDAKYAGEKPAYAESGRYAPYWNKLGGNIEVEPLLDKDIDVADWYLVPKETKREYITEPYPYLVQGRQVMLVSMVFPVIYQDRFIGIVSSDIVLDKLQEMVTRVNPRGYGGYTEILSNSGNIVANPEPRLLGEVLAASAKYGDEHAAEALDAVKNGRIYIPPAGDFYTVYLPIRFSDATRPWSVAVSIPMAEVFRNAVAIRNYVAGVSAAALCLIALILYFIANRVSRPILALARAAEALGEGDLETKVPLFRGGGEIGALSRTLNFMAAQIKEMIGKMRVYAGELEEKNTYLNRLNELKDEFLANTSHELRTPINGIIGIVESMVDGATGPLTREQKYNLAIVSSSGKRLSNMINDILDFTKLKNREIQLRIRPVDLKTVVDAVLALSKHLVKGKVLELANEIDESLPLIGADENRIQQILYNLIGNAVKFTEKGRIAVSAEVRGNMVAVSVSDTGIGIPENKFDRIFESFEQVDGSAAREYGGTGLGLSISKKLVELHGGTLTVESKIGDGSRFTFTVPASSEKRATDARERPAPILDAEDFLDGEGPQDWEGAGEPERPAGLAGDAAKILVVDDEPVNIQVLKNFLRIQDYRISTAYSGAEALGLIEAGEN